MAYLWSRASAAGHGLGCLGWDEAVDRGLCRRGVVVGGLGYRAWVAYGPCHPCRPAAAVVAAVASLCLYHRRVPEDGVPPGLCPNVGCRAAAAGGLGRRCTGHFAVETAA